MSENHNEMPILPQNYTLFWERCSFGVKDKIRIFYTEWAKGEKTKA